MVAKKKKNEARKALRAKIWASGKAKSSARNEAQLDRMRANIRLRKEGKLTPWEEARATRISRRASARAAAPGGKS